jgi:hypothetical protein
VLLQDFERKKLTDAVNIKVQQSLPSLDLSALDGTLASSSLTTRDAFNAAGTKALQITAGTSVNAGTSEVTMFMRYVFFYVCLMRLSDLN